MYNVSFLFNTLDFVFVQSSPEERRKKHTHTASEHSGDSNISSIVAVFSYLLLCVVGFACANLKLFIIIMVLFLCFGYSPLHINSYISFNLHFFRFFLSFNGNWALQLNCQCCFSPLFCCHCLFLFTFTCLNRLPVS